MHKETENEIEKLNKLIENVRSLDKYVKIADEYFKNSDIKFMYYAFTDILHINFMIDDMSDMEGIRETFINIGEKFSQPYLFGGTKSLLSSSKHILLSSHLSGKSCQLIQTGIENVPVYQVQCK